MAPSNTERVEPNTVLVCKPCTDARGNALENDREVAAAGEDGIFPPTVFTDAAYRRGVLVRGRAVERLATTTKGADEEGGEKQFVKVELVEDYFAPEPDDEHRRDRHQQIARYEYAGWSGAGVASSGVCPPATKRRKTGKAAPAASKSTTSTDGIASSVARGGFPKGRLLPALTPSEERLWRHSHSADAAASRRFPAQAVRLLGTITLRFGERAVVNDKGKARAKKGALDAAGLMSQRRRHFDIVNGHDVRRAPPSDLCRPPPFQVNRKRALNDVAEWAEEDAASGTRDGTMPGEDVLKERAETLCSYWRGIKDGPSMLECWGEGHDGGFVAPMLGTCGRDGDDDDGFVPLPVLLDWASDSKHCAERHWRWKKGETRTAVTDLQAGRKAELYGGLRSVETDGIAVLRCLQELSSAVCLYGMPLMMPYAVAELEFDGEEERLWKVRIGVYCNRLLPEVLTCRTLHVVMSALDDGSYRVTEPLHLPPLRDPREPAFASAPLPRVRMDEARDFDYLEGDGGGGSNDDDDQQVQKKEDKSVIVLLDSDSDSDDDDADGEEKKEEDDDVIVLDDADADYRGRDVALVKSTRDGESVSPFTPRGLLKLLESTGCDISAWPAIAKVLDPVLKLDLMLHQRHAVCWMMQMEHLGGFGINSILWEEREFLDGGKYYYSPALGQMRLNKPPEMKGGLLCDEMGLGKTLEVLGLIVATLGELKAEAKRAGEDSPEEEEDDDGDSTSHCTLIVVPPALAMQWVNEIRKAAGDALEVDHLEATTGKCRRLLGKDKDAEEPTSDADVVITTYGALERHKLAKILASVRWGRVVLDEMQEIRSSTTKIATNCEKLRCGRRWMLSGTPLFEGIGDLRGELNFLRLEPFAAGLEDGFFEFCVGGPWAARSRTALDLLSVLRLLMLRRSKDMTLAESGLPLLGLKGLKVEYVPVTQGRSERALYCWVEYLVSEHVRRDGNAKELKSRNLCLKLLRGLCLSPVLLNGGLGVSSQLAAVNRLMIDSNRRGESAATSTANGARGGGGRDRGPNNVRVVSCEGALRLLTQVERVANVDENFVTNQTFGMSNGGSRRNRAVDSVEVQFRAAEEEVEKAKSQRSAARRKRARAHWHLALELVTTGEMLVEGNGPRPEAPSTDSISDLLGRVARTSSAGSSSSSGPARPPHKFSLLWALRSITKHNRRRASLPYVLTRGWRPSPSFLREGLFASHPEWAWAHPLALQVDPLPEQVTPEDVSRAAVGALRRQPQAARSETSAASRPSTEAQRLNVVRCRTNGSSNWKAILQFFDEDDCQYLLKQIGSANGFPLKSSTPIPAVESERESKTANLRLAESEQKVYPCPPNQKKLADAKKALKIADLGFRIVSEKQLKKGGAAAALSKAVEPLRTAQPRTVSALLSSLGDCTLASSAEIAKTSVIISDGEAKMARLMPAMNCASKEIRELSAFETLEALAHNELEKTQCPICISPFGTGLTNSRKKPGPIAAMVSCGHFFCVDCIQSYCRQQPSSHSSLKCPNCRKPFSMDRDVVHVDHRLQRKEQEAHERRVVEAKNLVIQASSLLDKSHGQLDGSMWHALFLSFDLPPGVSRRAHEKFLAIPRDVLAHLRAATEMGVDCKRIEKPSSTTSASAGRSSKISALLRDLPLDERSVVFTGTQEGVLHLRTVLLVQGIDCRALFVGQDSKASETAVAEWELDEHIGTNANPPTPVLVVQAGAAAAGLTLIKACKIFLLEPFVRQEEEQQAFARCHRYGQEKDVKVKCYYSPVTVESRLLEWRRQCQAQSGNAKISTVMGDDDSDDDGDDDVGDIEVTREGTYEPEEKSEDTRRSMFLLGLVDENGDASQ